MAEAAQVGAAAVVREPRVDAAALVALAELQQPEARQVEQAQRARQPEEAVVADAAAMQRPLMPRRRRRAATLQHRRQLRQADVAAMRPADVAAVAAAEVVAEGRRQRLKLRKAPWQRRFKKLRPLESSGRRKAPAIRFTMRIACSSPTAGNASFS